MLLALLLGIWLFKINCRKTGITCPDLVDLMLILSICGIAGARILYIVLFPHQFSSFADYAALHEGGLVFFGGFAAAAVGLLIYLRRKKLPVAATFDCLIPPLAFGHAIGRLGCLLNNCCYGAATDMISIYRLPEDPPGCYRHPTQLYESIFLVAAGAVSNLLLHKKITGQRLRPGILSGLYLAAYSLWRFLIEFWRDDDRGGFYTAMHLSPSQLGATVLMAIACLVVVYCYNYNAGSGDKNK